MSTLIAQDELSRDNLTQGEFKTNIEAFRAWVELAFGTDSTASAVRAVLDVNSTGEDTTALDLKEDKSLIDDLRKQVVSTTNVSGTADAIIVDFASGATTYPGTYFDGMFLDFTATANNTGTVTLKLGTVLTVKDVYVSGVPLVADIIVSGSDYRVTFDSGNDRWNLSSSPIDLKADKDNVLELNNTDAFTPTTDYHPATKVYVDDNAGLAGTKEVDEASIADGKILEYNSTSGKLEYVTPGVYSQPTTAGAVGTYGFFKHATSTDTDYAFGSTVAGSALRPVGMRSGTFATSSSGSSPGASVYWSGSTQAGTWRCMGYQNNFTDSGSESSSPQSGQTVWLRIS